MRFAVTVLSPAAYAHGAAFHEGAETLFHGLRRLGHDVVLGADTPGSAPGRRGSYLLADRRCVVSERGASAAEEAPFEEGVAFAAYGDLVERCVDLLARPDERRRVAEAGFRAMSARDEAAYLRKVVGAAAPG